MSRGGVERGTDFCRRPPISGRNCCFGFPEFFLFLICEIFNLFSIREQTFAAVVWRKIDGDGQLEFLNVFGHDQEGKSIAVLASQWQPGVANWALKMLKNNFC